MRKRVGGKNSKFRGSEVRKKVVWRAGGRGMGNKGEGGARAQGRSLRKDRHNTDTNVDESPGMTLSERSRTQKSACSIYIKLYSRETGRWWKKFRMVAASGCAWGARIGWKGA